MSCKAYSIKETSNYSVPTSVSHSRPGQTGHVPVLSKSICVGDLPFLLSALNSEVTSGQSGVYTVPYLTELVPKVEELDEICLGLTCLAHPELTVAFGGAL